jgi:hypothetical protein
VGVPVIPRQRAELSGVDCERMRHLHACDSTADAATTKCSVGTGLLLPYSTGACRIPRVPRVPQSAGSTLLGVFGWHTIHERIYTILSVCETDHTEYCTDDETSQ